jgi:DNA-binding GntR family transcriptional regulator
VLLEQTGLVVRSQGRKTTVTSLTKEEVRDRLSIRVALEEIACVKAASLMREADFIELGKLAKTITANVAKNDYLAMTLADTRFHHFMWERAETPVLLRTLDQITMPLFAFLGVLHAKGLHNLQAGKRHEAIVSAMRSRKSDIVRKAIRDHIEGSYRTFLESETTS